MKGLLLISGGLDSPVAGYLMKKRINLIAIHFNNEPFTDKKPLEISKRLLKKIGVRKLYIVPHGFYTLTEVLKNCNHRFMCVICRRNMFRIAEKIAEKEKTGFLITGENLGQVASQTLENLTLCDSATKIPILRPLLCYDKNDIISIAKEIGTYEISTEPSICCTATPRNPVTRARLKDIIKEEEKMDITNIVKSSFEDSKIILINQ
jgi:thiamine biosynthesis protein ThiI